MVKRVTENALLKYNFVVGAGKHVIMTLKTDQR